MSEETEVERGEAAPGATPPRRWLTRKKVALIATLGVLGPVGSGVGAMGVNAHIERVSRSRIHDRPEDAPSRYVAIVLGARVHKDRTPSAALEDRLEAARRLYALGRVKRILVTGDHGVHGYNEVQVMRDWLLKRGVAEADLFMDHAGFRTHDSMQRAARIFRVKGAIVCTQRFHLARSIWLARQAGIDAHGVVADRRVYRARRFNKAREFAARVKAFLDVKVLDTQPRYLGEEIPITGSSRKTYDDETLRRIRRVAPPRVMP